jgi:tRNA uridine 5-carbamoylmethylation protein Kti12
MRESGWKYISRDEIRFSIVKDEEEYFSQENKVFYAFINEINKALKNSSISDIIADATHLNWGSRRKLLVNLNLEEVRVIPVVITGKLKDILERNNLRNGRARVPEEVVRNMYSRMNDPEKDPYKYAAIMRVRN